MHLEKLRLLKKGKFINSMQFRKLKVEKFNMHSQKFFLFISSHQSSYKYFLYLKNYQFQY